MTGARRSRGPGPAQAQRSAQTREAVIAATVELLGEGGPDAATAAAISERSGVSWGGIQHQFGHKDAVLDAALVWLIADLAQEWSLPEPVPTDLDDRARALVDLVWRMVRHRSYPALMALLRHRATGVADDTVMALRAGATRTTRELFADLDLDQATVDTVDAFCFAAVGGIADQQRLATIDARFTARSLQLVADAIATELRA